MPNETIEISKFNFWLVTTLLGALVIGVGAWATNVNSQMIQQQISMAEMKGLVQSIDSRLEENLAVVSRIHRLESDLRAVKTTADLNLADLSSRKGIRFNMTEYDKYIRPVQEDLSKRVTRLEAKVE